MAWYLWTVVFAGVLTSVAGDAHRCQDNQTACVTGMQDVLLDQNKFWFGTSFLMRYCPVELQMILPACMNPDRERFSILGKVLKMNESTESAQLLQISRAISLLHVTFNAPEAEYYACGHLFSIPAVIDHELDPLHITEVDSWSLDHVPTVTWEAENVNTLYTLVVWDVGYYYLHGLYINCVNGTLDTCAVVQKYHSPRNGQLQENVYIFALYEQTRTMTVGEASGLLYTVIGMDMGRFHPATFASLSSGAVSNSPSFANLLSVVSDPRAVQSMRDSLITNNCPRLVSQMPAFHKFIMTTNVTVAWSDDATTFSLGNDNPYLTTLNIHMEVEYSTDDFSVESCCSTQTLTRGKFLVDPFSTRAERPAMARNTPRVHLSPMVLLATGSGISDNMYTLFMLDVAPALEGDVVRPDIQLTTHWLVTNIKEADVSTGDELAPYFGPNPFTPNSARAYMFLLVHQPNNMKVNNSIFTEFCPNGGQRCRLQWAPLMEAWGLTDIVGVTWFLAEQDGFARQRMYNMLGARTKAQVCIGMSGYSDPCPENLCANHAVSWTPFKTNILVTLLVFVILRHLSLL